MALRKTTGLNSWQSKSFAAVMLVSAGFYANIAASQTVVIGGSGSSPIEVNLGAINPQPSYTAPYSNPYQTNAGSLQNGGQYSTSSRIVYGNEVITLTPPGSRPKKKKVITAKKKPAKAKSKIVAKTAPPTQAPAKPAPEVKVAKVAPPVEKAAPKVEAAPANVEIASQKNEVVAKPAPIVAKKKPVAPPEVETVVEAPVVIVKSTETPPTKQEKPVAKAEVPKAVIPAENKPAAKKPEPEIQVAAIAPETKTTPTAPSSGATNHILFQPEQSKLPGGATRQLKELAKTLKSNNDRIQLIAYADANSNSAARRLSLGRALVVRSKLMELGVPNNKIEVRALGKPDDDLPADRVELNLITR
ncbi:MAG: OmpA family protein [Sneathiella sp.]